jgi:acetyl-CoA carboxylase biotin carboxyl carrier protein
VDAAPAVSPGVGIESPMGGTFYSAPSPEQPAFAQVGDKVS